VSLRLSTYKMYIKKTALLNQKKPSKSNDFILNLNFVFLSIPDFKNLIYGYIKLNIYSSLKEFKL